MYVHACILSVLYGIEVADHIYTVLYIYAPEGATIYEYMHHNLCPVHPFIKVCTVRMWYVLKYRIGVQDVANKTTIFHDGHHACKVVPASRSHYRTSPTDQLTKLPCEHMHDSHKCI